MNIIAHPDELFLKGANQRFFYDTLIKNLKNLFKPAEVSRLEGGLWLTKFKRTDLDRLTKTPGIVNLAKAESCSPTLKQIQATIDKIIDRSAKSFRITASRSYKQYHLTSKQLAEQLGDYVRRKYKLKVDLANYDLNININILKNQAIIYTQPLTGAGGLPVGTSGKILCLLSGGIDSPVAAYKMMNRGAEIGLIHCQNQTHVADEVGEKIFDLAKILSQYQPTIRLFMVPYERIQRQIIMKVSADYRMIINRRIFFRLAEKVATANNYQAVATGDSLGQVASQTIDNLSCLNHGLAYLNLAPLIGLNKKDIINMAQHLGTFGISKLPYEDCCSLLVAKHPQTKARLIDILKIEANLDLSILDEINIKSYNVSMNK